jgi:predicted outer membrane repeat protein
MQSKTLFSFLFLTSGIALGWACGDEPAAATAATAASSSSSGVGGGASRDEDEDGYTADVDCDDDDDTVFPGAPELCDNKLNDCNKLSKDIGVATLFPAAGGPPKDLSETFRAGTAEAPATYSLDEPGTVKLCQRVDSKPWYLSVVVNSDSTIEGVGQDILVSGGGKAPLFEVASSSVTVTLRSMQLRDGAATKDWEDASKNMVKVGSGVYCAVLSDLIVSDLTFEANGGERGVAFLANGCKAAFSNVTFSKNLTTSEVVALDAGAELVHDGGRYIENPGGGVGVHGASKFSFVGRSNQPEFASNGSEGHALGGILLTAGDVTVTGTTFKGNRAKRGGAIAVTAAAASTLTISKSNFEENEAVSMTEPGQVAGGAIYLAGMSSLSATEEVKFSASVPMDEDVAFDGCSMCNADPDGIARYDAAALTEKFSCDGSAGCAATP